MSKKKSKMKKKAPSLPVVAHKYYRLFVDSNAFGDNNEDMRFLASVSRAIEFQAVYEQL